MAGVIKPWVYEEDFQGETAEEIKLQPGKELQNELNQRRSSG